MKVSNLCSAFLLIILHFSAIGQTQVESSIMHDGIERTFIIYVPDSYQDSEAVPLVINYHGLTSNSFDQMFYGDFRPIADRENFIIVHPQGTLNGDDVTYWNAQFDPNGVDDIGFSAALIDSLSARYNIDAKRVYSTGMSNGGFMSYTLACELSDKIAAIASVTGSMTTVQARMTCDPANVCPIMQIHGTDDSVVPYEGQQFLASIDEVMTFWANQYNCNNTPEITAVDDSNTIDRSTVERQVYTDCDENSTLELFKVENGGHTWPGTVFKFGVTNCDINASEEIWRFFSQYSLDGNISSVVTEKNEEKISLYPTPADERLEIRFSEAGLRHVKIVDLSGQDILQATTQKTSLSIDISGFYPGTYILETSYKTKKTFKKFVKI